MAISKVKYRGNLKPGTAARIMFQEKVDEVYEAEKELFDSDGISCEVLPLFDKKKKVTKTGNRRAKKQRPTKKRGATNKRNTES